MLYNFCQMARTKDISWSTLDLRNIGLCVFKDHFVNAWHLKACEIKRVGPNWRTLQLLSSWTCCRFRRFETGPPTCKNINISIYQLCMYLNTFLFLQQSWQQKTNYHFLETQLISSPRWWSPCFPMSLWFWEHPRRFSLRCPRRCNPHLELTPSTFFITASAIALGPASADSEVTFHGKILVWCYCSRDPYGDPSERWDLVS